MKLNYSSCQLSKINTFCSFIFFKYLLSTYLTCDRQYVEQWGHSGKRLGPNWHGTYIRMEVHIQHRSKQIHTR